MIRETPFHPRTSEANKTGLWSHWSGYLATDRYQMSDKFEYFAIRNSAAVIDTSPLYKYRIIGSDAERFLAGVLARDIRKCRPGQAHYTVWCDDDGWVVEDGVVLRHSDDEFLLTAAEPNMAFLQDLAGQMAVQIEDVSNDFGALALQGPYAREILKQLAPEMEEIGYFHLTPAKVGNAAVTISRTGYTGDLGYEIWVERDDAVGVWDTLFEVAAPYGVIPAGQTALLIARIEAGLVLIDVDFYSARYAWNDDQRTTPHELGLGWMLRDLASDDRAFIGRRAIERELADATSRWKTVGIMVDYEDWNRVFNERGVIPPKDHTPEHGGMMIYDEKLERIGYTPSFVYSPMAQRHVGIARVRPEHAALGTELSLEVTIDHRYDVVKANVSRLPFFNPPRKTA
ncbi:MAG: aminomethyl transferase family protein [Acidimicrobiia bacterium]|nr:aminomethyl transferase family protein [Acidimicrobiia bacterium]